ncbi:hypothetical protein [Pontibacter ruber]|uniref:Outer membrane protein beta-barrel domain-containing protein n=1 Tax=Pontibacter ruber TaxID=1343895 RepID=A0ABW5CZW7_9BACT
MTLILLSIVSVGNAQKYRTAAGIRLDGKQFGITVQQKLHEKGTLEGIAAVGSREFSGTLLYEWHFPILGRGLNYYLGAGGHVGNLKDSGVFTGADAIAGIEYKVNFLPFVLSADVKPAVHINHEDWVNLTTGISIRYIIVKEKKKKKGIWPFGKQEDEDEDEGGIFRRKKDKQQEEEDGGIFRRKKNKQQEEEQPGILDIFKKRDNY